MGSSTSETTFHSSIQLILISSLSSRYLMDVLRRIGVGGNIVWIGEGGLSLFWTRVGIFKFRVILITLWASSVLLFYIPLLAIIPYPVPSRWSGSTFCGLSHRSQIGEISACSPHLNAFDTFLSYLFLFKPVPIVKSRTNPQNTNQQCPTPQPTPTPPLPQGNP